MPKSDSIYSGYSVVSILDNGVVMVKKEAELDFAELLEKYDYKFQKGDLVKGTICGFDSQGVMVDIGAKTTAVIPTYEAVEKGENIEETVANEAAKRIIRPERPDDLENDCHRHRETEQEGHHVLSAH